MRTETASSPRAVTTNVASRRHSPLARNHTGPTQGSTLVNAATHHALGWENPTTAITASSQNTLPDRISGRQASHAPTASTGGRGRTSQAIPVAAATTHTAQNTPHGKNVRGQITCANSGL